MAGYSRCTSRLLKREEVKYKPLSEAELLAAEIGAKRWNQGLLCLIEQARRANALAEAAHTIHSKVHPTEEDEQALWTALAAYLGEEETK